MTGYRRTNESVYVHISRRRDGVSWRAESADGDLIGQGVVYGSPSDGNMMDRVDRAVDDLLDREKESV